MLDDLQGDLLAKHGDEAVEVVEDGNDFFAPVSFDLIDSLVSEYDAHTKSITAVHEFVSGRMAASVMHYFLEGNATEDRGRTSLSRSAAQLFDPAGAIGSLRASYWSKALQLTDVLDMMPQKRRNEWSEQMRNPSGQLKDHSARSSDRRNHPEWFDLKGDYIDEANSYAQPPLPDFTQDTVRNTLSGLLAMRAQFLGERVDGIFQGLSGHHVTNAPEGFGKRMIIAHALSEHHYTDHRRTGLINDLRCVIAKFMGRDEPKYQATDGAIGRMARGRRWGEWVTLDGGALRLRIYKVGTAHMEVHPDMAWRLNAILASLHPAAIPAEFRQRPKRKAKAVELIKRPLPFAVLAVLENVRQVKERVGGPNGWPERYQDVPNTVSRGYVDKLDKHVEQEANDVLAALGGVHLPGDRWQFDYPPFEVLEEVIASGCMPDQKAHQFYATRERMARMAVELAEHMPKERTVCVEVSGLHCKVLEAKGFKATCADFLAWSEQPGRAGSFSRVLMNPPFDRGQWRAHVEHAAGLVRAGGRLVAILPSGARGTSLPGFNTTWHGPFANEFPGTSVEVVILVADRVS